jgi:DNA-binding CsgD family transcriptional regulator
MIKELENKTPKEQTPTKSLLLKSLNSTEYEILKLLSRRKKIFEIAMILNISERKVYQYKKSMMYKLDIECELDLFKIFLDQF